MCTCGAQNSMLCITDTGKSGTGLSLTDMTSSRRLPVGEKPRSLWWRATLNEIHAQLAQKPRAKGVTIVA